LAEFSALFDMGGNESLLARTHLDKKPLVVDLSILIVFLGFPPRPSKLSLLVVSFLK